MKGRFGDSARLNHILDTITEIKGYIKDINFSEFEVNSMVHNACIKQLEIIGEAATHLSESYKSNHPEISWKEIIGLRNVLIHEYFGVDIKIIWDIIKNDLPVLEQQVYLSIKTNNQS